MLIVPGPRQTTHFCDSIPRRSFLRIGGLAMGGLSLPELLRAESQAGIGKSHKAVIMVYLNGGPPHQDMVDLKPDAPREFRGEFSPIKTNIPGLDLCELMPRTARIMDKFAVIRSLVGSNAGHSSYQCVTGRSRRNPAPGGWPELGSILWKLKGPVNESVPPAIDLVMKMAHKPYNLPGPGFLGNSFAPFKPSEDSKSDMVLNIDHTRFGGRRGLLASLDQFRRGVDRNGIPNHIDPFTKQAMEVLTSSHLVDALDLEKEDPRVRERYGKDDPKVLSIGQLGYQGIVSKFLLARRCVEAGARCVTVSFADFDWHGGNFSRGRKVLPLFDHGISALVEDLHQRGLEEDVSVVIWGEFGRTPRVNKSAGRDHWPQVAFAMLAGGGLRTGQVIGSTNRLAEYADSRPVHFQEVFATLYQKLGIDVSTATLTDLSGRPRYLLDPGHEPLRELL